MKIAYSKLKFNMMFNCGEIRIRTIEDLRENFFVEDVLENFGSGTLERWLDCRRYKEELEAVRALKESGKTKAREILEGLMRIFYAEADTGEIDAELEFYDYLDERRKFWEYVRENGLHELEELRGKVSSLTSEHDDLRGTVSSLTRERDDLQKKYDSLKKRGDDYAEAAKKYEALLEQQNEKFRKALDEVRDMAVRANHQLGKVIEVCMEDDDCVASVYTYLVKALLGHKGDPNEDSPRGNLNTITDCINETL
ncbi:MAG: hypothetical protein IJT02_07005 [Synergistaceae bacterium]|nr:hypothetical protein [Synergistaceae bacterium]